MRENGEKRLKRINLDDMKFIPKDEIPSILKTSKYDGLFRAIPKGKALVLDRNDKTMNIYMALRNRQKRGLHKDLIFMRSGDKAYVLNPSV